MRIISIQIINKKNAGCKMIKDKGKTKRVFTGKELIRFIEIVKGHRYETAFLLMLTTGIAPSELVALRWRDIREYHAIINKRGRFKNGIMAFAPYTKVSNKIRPIPLNRTVFNLLDVKMKKQIVCCSIPQEFRELVFLTERGYPYHIPDLIRSFNRLVAKEFNSPKMCILQNTAQFFIETQTRALVAKCILGNGEYGYVDYEPNERAIVGYGIQIINSKWDKLLEDSKKYKICRFFGTDNT